MEVSARPARPLIVWAAAHAVRRLREGTDDHELTGRTMCWSAPLSSGRGTSAGSTRSWRDAGLGSPLGDPPEGPPGELLATTDQGAGRAGADPLVIQAAVQAARADGQAVPGGFCRSAVHGGHRASRATFFVGSGKKSGHGMGWVPSPHGELPDAPPWAEAAPHPVIALLDSGVQPHAWLNASHPSFLLEADVMDGWASPLPPDDRFQRPNPRGHALGARDVHRRADPADRAAGAGAVHAGDEQRGPRPTTATRSTR